MIIGYARVSTEAQELALQLDKLKEYGCIYVLAQTYATIYDIFNDIDGIILFL